MAITFTDKVKTILQISDSSKDTYIDEMIPLIEEWIKGYCDDDFLDAEGNTVYPAGYEITAINMIGYNLNVQLGVNNKSLGSRMSVSFNQDYPESIIRGLKRKVKIL